MIALTTVSTNNLLLPTLNDTAGWQQLFSHPHFGWAMVAVAAIAAFSWVFVRRLATVFSAQVNGIDVLFGRRVIDGVMFPIA